MIYEDYDGKPSIYSHCYDSYIQPRFRVIFSRGSMQFSIELSANDDRNAVYRATKDFTKYVPNTELWGVFKVERV